MSDQTTFRPPLVTDLFANPRRTVTVGTWLAAALLVVTLLAGWLIGSAIEHAPANRCARDGGIYVQVQGRGACLHLGPLQELVTGLAS